MYAVIRDGGKQYRVKPGDIITVDKKGNLNIGDKVEFKDVLMLSGEEGTNIGSELKDTTKVIGKVDKQSPGEKLLITKFRRRKNSRTKKGHREKYTQVKIQEIIA
ncbi:MAG TPA: 50S ribosomal protein L21 [Candidatus Brocadiia bacterium]|nr:50S ribosomal protein L21 [Planctomycetota bacterium]MBI4008386.1 50S ribosomal protein L21 [Planctomycetota bacterium]MDO8091856.1 50S ribosomal protein L21 [Candidatus Brocadiales bacterium]